MPFSPHMTSTLIARITKGSQRASRPVAKSDSNSGAHSAAATATTAPIRPRLIVIITCLLRASRDEAPAPCRHDDEGGGPYDDLCGDVVGGCGDHRGEQPDGGGPDGRAQHAGQT